MTQTPICVAAYANLIRKPKTMPTGAENITPYDHDRAKTEQVREMFDSIAPAYDFMNRAMTLGIDRVWRRRAVACIKAENPADILDVATGTGDVAIALACAIGGCRVTGIDLSEGMVALGREKVQKAGLQSRVTLGVADCLALSMADNSFDCITVAYGVRNFERLAEGYAEMLRVLRPGGLLAVLELSTPRGAVARPLYKLYTRRIIPAIGRFVSGDSRAYTYLPESIAAVAQGEAMLDIMRSVGFTDAQFKSYTFGTCTLYTARKPR